MLNSATKNLPEPEPMMSSNTSSSIMKNSKECVLASVRNLSRLQDLESRFNAKLVGQEQAVSEVCQTLFQIIAGFNDETVPYGVLLFAGPTGVGKTEMAKMIKEELDIPLLRYDMSEYRERHCLSSLLGSPAGYRDSEKGGNLVTALKENPVCIVLFDEIEKAHPELFPVFLQLFDEGRLTDRMGNTVCAKHTIFILTTNLGANEIRKNNHLPLPTIVSNVLEPIFIKKFTPELYNRFHKTIVFNSLSEASIKRIAESCLLSLKNDIYQRKKINLKWNEHTIAYIMNWERNPEMGARGIQRRIRNLILPFLARNFADKIFFEGDSIELDRDQDNKLKLTVYPRENAKVDPITAPQTKPIQENKNIIYIEKSGQPAKNFIGKHVVRVAPCGNNASYSIKYNIEADSMKIIHISDQGLITFEKKCIIGKEIERSVLGSQWNDDKWMLITPQINAKDFFVNLCNDITDPGIRETSLSIVKEIFNESSIRKKGRHLNDEDPYGDLQTIIKENPHADYADYWLSKILQLKAYTGPISVKVIDSSIKKSATESSGVYVSRNYDFILSPAIRAKL